jgi:general secretion pathway protein A
MPPVNTAGLIERDAETIPSSAVLKPAPQFGIPMASDLWTTETAAWLELGSFWGLDLRPSNACQVALQQQVQCFSTPRMTLNGLRQLNRPGVLIVHLPGQAPRRVLVTEIRSDTLILQGKSMRWEVPFTEMGRVWRGDYATLWRQPAGTKGRIQLGATGAAQTWLEQSLLELQAKGFIPEGAESFPQRLVAFQRSQGISAGGRASPMTFMQVNLTIGVDEPRLIQPRPTISNVVQP